MSSCSLVLPADAVQCEVAQDCIDRGFPDTTLCQQQYCEEPPVDPIWGCLGKVEEPLIIPGEVYVPSFVILDAVTNLTPSGFTARLCAAVDVDCDSPILEDLTIGSDGRLTFSVTAGFQGYLEVNATDIMPGILPIGPVVSDSPEVGEQLHLLRTIVVESVAMTAGTTIDPAQGHMLGLLASCDGFGRAGLSFSYEPESGTSFYTIGFTPDIDTTVTDEAGRFGVFNLDPGFATFIGTRPHPTDGTPEIIGRSRALIRPGTLTYVGVGPYLF